MAAAEGRIEARLEELRAAATELEARLGAADDMARQDMAHLVGIYETMKPKEAAKIFEELDMDTLLEVAERMKERKLAPIMAKMHPEKARDMTVELSRLRELPLETGPTGRRLVGQRAGG